MPPGSPRIPQGRPTVPPGPMVGDMVAQWWGALPPKPPGMSAANQAASVVIDFQQGHRLGPPPMTGHNPRIEDSQTNFHWKFEGHTPRIEDSQTKIHWIFEPWAMTG